jgi:hypothetical protein
MPVSLLLVSLCQWRGTAADRERIGSSKAPVGSRRLPVEGCKLRGNVRMLECGADRSRARRARLMGGLESCHVPSITKGHGPAYEARSLIARWRCTMHETCAGWALLPSTTDVFDYSVELSAFGQSRSLIDWPYRWSDVFGESEAGFSKGLFPFKPSQFEETHFGPSMCHMF